MIVCVCHRVSDRDIEHEVRQGCHSFEELQDDLRVGTGCGACLECARDTFDVARACRPDAVVAGSKAAEIHVIALSEISRAPLAASC
jgi:bacterioferritin-associated ferredoxin